MKGDVFDATGNDIPYAPDNTFNAGLDIDIPLESSFDGYVHIDYSYVDEQATDAANTPSRTLPSYQLVDLRAGIVNERFDLALWVKNATDEDYLLGSNTLETYYPGFLRATGAPRIWGATLRLFF